MPSVNKVIILGNLGRNPDIRYLPSGDAIANIAVATSYKRDQKEYTEWHRIVFFGRLAEIVGQYLKKGASVYVEGRLQTRKFTDKDGVEKWATEIVGEQMQMLGSAPGANQAADEAQQSDNPAQPAPAAPAAAKPVTQRPAAKRGAKSAPAPAPAEDKAEDDHIPF